MLPPSVAFALAASLLPGGDPRCPVAELHPTPPIESPDPTQVQFGYAVESDGERLVVSSPFEYAFHENGSGFDFLGAVYVHRWESGRWVLEQKVKGPGEGVEGFNLYGVSCDVDGETLVVGAPAGCFHDCIQTPPGEVTFYERIGGEWTAVLRTTASDASVSDAFGSSISIDGERVAIGALFSKKVYLFERIAGVWTEVAIVSGPPDASQFGSEFGRDVSLAGDVLAVAAPEDVSAGIAAEGAVYVYELGSAGWTQVGKLVSPLGFQGETFGNSVALSSETLAVGSARASFGTPFSPVVNQNGGAACGAVLVYERRDGTWSLDAILGSGVAPTADFGRSVALDGDELLVGSSPAAFGRAELFRRGPLGWAPLARIEPPDAPNSEAELGWSVALRAGRLAAGAPGHFVLQPLEGSAFAASTGALRCESLLGAPALVRLSAGGSHVLSLDAGDARAGQLYIVLGSATGTSPGFPLGGAHVPLAFDGYTSVSISLANQAPFASTLGLLDASGRATAAIELPAGLSPDLAGVSLHHAFVAFDVGLGAFSFGSAPARLTLLP